MGTFTLSHTTHVRFHPFRPRTWFVRNRTRTVTTAPIAYNAPAGDLQYELYGMGMGASVTEGGDGSQIITFGGTERQDKAFRDAVFARHRSVRPSRKAQ